MRVLVINNLLGRLDRLDAVLARAESQTDAVFVLGNFVTPEASPEPETYAQMFERLGRLQVPVYFVPGAHDTSFGVLSQAMQQRHGAARLHLVHRHAALLGEHDAVAGFGGLLSTTASPSQGQLVFPAWEAHAAFEHVSHYSDGFKHAHRRILLFATPPQSRHVDDDGTAHIGSREVNRIIHTYQPHLVCCAGPASGRGSEHIEGTLVVNPGSLAGGAYALVDLDHLQVQLERLIDPLPADTGAVRRVVVALDGSPRSWRALELAAGIARAFRAQVTLVHAFVPVRDALGEPYVDDVLAERIGHGERLLHDAAQHIVDLAPECEVLQGPAAEAIIRVAETQHADLVVLGARGHGAVGQLIGSISNRVLRHAPCAVVLARDEPHTPALHERIQQP